MIWEFFDKYIWHKHNWISLSKSTATFTISNKMWIEFEIAPKVCLKCSEMKWEQIK